MKINGVNSGYQPKRQAVSFEAIHPTKYYLRCADGQFHRVTNPDLIRRLQGRVVTWLNKSMHDSRRALEGNPRKVKSSETSAEKAMRERLVKFFVDNDKDYAKRSAVKSSYIGPKDKVSTYILTGDTVDLAGDGKPIGKVHSNIRETREFMRSYYGISEEQANNYVSMSDALRLSQAKADYHKQSEEAVGKLMKNETIDRSTVVFYFSPIVGKKSKKPSKFELVNAMFQKIMIP